MESSENSFEYEPLDTRKREIRLVILAPGSFEDDVHCTLRRVSLDENVEYEALSYTWGDPSITDEIFLHSQSFQVTTNLVSALRHLRHADMSRPRTLWVDAIAINQQNVQERAQQVGIMGDIYRLESQDLLWLGAEAPDNEAMKLFDDLSSEPHG
jgi:Heterokaryon incompatibility protein (HET)